MLAVSARFLEQLREPHVVVVEVLVVPADGSDPFPLAITGGSVRGDRTAQVRRSVSLTLAAETVRALAELPFGAYLDVGRGVRFGDLTSEVPRLGWFRVDSVGSTMPDGGATVGGSDRMAQVVDEPLLVPFAAGGAIPSTGIVTLVQQVFAGLPAHVSTAGEPMLVDVTYSTDRAAAVAQLAQAISAQAYFDADGELVVSPLPSETDAAVWTVDAGEQGVLVAYSDALERAGAANGVLVRGQASADVAPVEVLVVDDDPASPTFYGGAFGRVVVVIESTAVQDVAQATDVATAELAKRLGLTRTLQLTSAPNPALEPADVVDVVLEDGTTESHVVDAVTIPLDVTQPVQLETRSQNATAGFGMAAGAEAFAALAGARLLGDELLEVAV